MEDHFHPSPLGTALASAVILATVRCALESRGAGGGLPSLSDEPPPAEQLFSRARRMMAPGQTGRLPTPEELAYFWKVGTELAAGYQAKGF